MNALTQHLLESLAAIEERDKATARRCVRAAEATLGSSRHPHRVQIRAVDCALDIENWQIARTSVLSAIDLVTHDDGLDRLAC